MVTAVNHNPQLEKLDTSKIENCSSKGGSPIARDEKGARKALASDSASKVRKHLLDVEDIGSLTADETRGVYEVQVSLGARESWGFGPAHSRARPSCACVIWPSSRPLASIPSASLIRPLLHPWMCWCHQFGRALYHLRTKVYLLSNNSTHLLLWRIQTLKVDF